MFLFFYYSQKGMLLFFYLPLTAFFSVLMIEEGREHDYSTQESMEVDKDYKR